MKRKVSIIIPIVRPESAKRCIEAIKKYAGMPMGQYEIVDSVDTQGIGCPRMVKALTRIAKNDLVMFLGDDCEPQKDFLKNALRAMDSLPDGWGVVGLNTEDPRGTNPMAHWLAHKKMLEHIEGGDFFSTEYKHCWGDDELKDIAEEMGRWTLAEDSKIKHYHPINKSAEWDDTHDIAYSDENKKHDKTTYLRRKTARMKKKHGVRLAIAEPLTDDTVYSHFHFSSVRVITNYMLYLFENEMSVAVDFLAPDYPGQIDNVRNGLVAQALMFGCTHILFMDTDQIYSDFDMIQKLLAHKKIIVGAKVHRRYPPFDPLLLRGEPGTLYSVPDSEVESKGLIQVGATGCGCILYDTEAFLNIDPPWFELTVGEFGQPIGEDVGFCEKLKTAGYKIYVDCSIEIKHLSLLAVDWGTYKLYKKLKGGEKNG